MRRGSNIKRMGLERTRVAEDIEQRDPCANNILGQVYSKNRISIKPDEFIDISIPPFDSGTLDTTLLTSKLLHHQTTISTSTGSREEKRLQSLSERKFRRKSTIAKSNVLTERSGYLKSSASTSDLCSASTSDLCSMFSGRSGAFSKPWSKPDNKDLIERWTGLNLQNNKHPQQKHYQYRSRRDLLVNLKNMQQSITLLNNIVSNRSNVSTLNPFNSSSYSSVQSSRQISRCGSMCSVSEEVTLLPYKDPPLAYRISSPCRSNFRTLSILSRYRRHTPSYIADDLSILSLESSSSENDNPSHVSQSFKFSKVEADYWKGCRQEKVRKNIRSKSSESRRSHDRERRIRRSQEYLDEFKYSTPVKMKCDLIPVREKGKCGQINKVCLENSLGSNGSVTADVVCPMYSTTLKQSPSTDGDVKQKFEWSFSTRDLESDNSRSSITTIDHVSPVIQGSFSSSSIATSVMDEYICNCHFGENAGYCIVHSDCNKLNDGIPSSRPYDYETSQCDDRSTPDVETLKPRPDSNISLIKDMKTLTYGQADLSFTFDSGLKSTSALQVEARCYSVEVKDVTVKREPISQEAYQTTRHGDVMDTTDNEGSELMELKSQRQFLRVGDENSDRCAELYGSHDTINTNMSQEINSGIPTTDTFDQEVYDTDPLLTVMRNNVVMFGDDKEDDYEDNDDGEDKEDDDDDKYDEDDNDESSPLITDAMGDAINSFCIANKNTDCMINQSELILEEISEEISDENATQEELLYNAKDTSPKQIIPETLHELTDESMTDYQLYEDETLPATPTDNYFLELPTVRGLDDYERRDSVDSFDSLVSSENSFIGAIVANMTSLVP